MTIPSPPGNSNYTWIMAATGGDTVKPRNTELTKWFRQSAPYVNAHRGHTFVLMLSGETIAHPHFANTVSDIALLNSLGIRLVLVFGAKPQIEQKLRHEGCATRFHRHHRVTDNQAFTLIKQIIGQVQLEITANLSMGLINTPMQGVSLNVVSGNFVTAQPMGVVDGIDYHFTGKVRRIDIAGIKRQLADHSIVLISPIGYSVTGESFNLAADEVATRLATGLKAQKMIGFCEGQGLVNGQQQVISEMFPEQAQEHLARLEASGESHGSGASYLRAAIASSQAGVPRCHLVSYQADGALLQELFSRDGIGTQIVRKSTEQFRRATIDDIGGILELIRPLEEQGILARRSREQLEMEVNQFTIVERDQMVIGCAALYPFPPERIGEMACVATHPEYRRDSRGELLLTEIENQARHLGLTRLFVLTTHSIHWFRERGFNPVELDALPMAKQQMYNLQRKSKILIKEL